MKRKVDSLMVKAVYNRRIATVKPVAGHRWNIGLDRFTLRGRTQIDAHWKSRWIVHNLLRVHR